MKAFVNAKGASGAILEMCDAPAPTPGPNDLLVAVRAIGLNRADLARPIGNPDNKAANIAGMEMAGEVIAIGSAVQGWKMGDRVMSMTTKSYAEQALCDARVAMRVPVSMSFEEAAATPVFYSTGHDALVTNGELKAGDSVLIAGVAAGVGIAMIHIAKAMGARLIAGTSRSGEKLARLKGHGLDLAIETGKDDLVAACMAASDKKGIDVIMDNVGAGLFAALTDAAAVKARYVTIGRLGGKVDEIDLDKIALKRMKVIGVTFRTRSLDEKIEITRRLVADLMPHLESGGIKPVIDKVFAFDEAPAAQDYMRSTKHLGKIVLKL
ncbi:MAG: zinc-binding dehydrogenase [Beijerinckiaceae bacterium]|nr:zinc-binding dehydrogenase [Beijerinckiaceae bacterium]